jgi:hypothetical protein
MSIISEGLRWFFKELLGDSLHELSLALKHKWEQKTGVREVFKFRDFNDLTKALASNEIEGVADIQIKSVCLSNFAPLYLCYPDTFENLNARIRQEVGQAKALYDSLKKRHKIEGDSLFLKAAKGEIKIDSLFREYVKGKKLRFLNLSLARFEPLTENICYSALFEAGKELKQHTAPLKADTHLEPYVPLFYDTTFPRGIERLSYVDVEIYGKIMPLPFHWENLLRNRGVQVVDHPYCIYLPNYEPYYVDIRGLQTSMSLDSWIVFSLPKLKLELPWYCRFEPTSEQSRRTVSKTFTDIYNELLSTQSVKVLFYSDYVQPFVNNVLPVFNDRKIKNLLSLRTSA